MDHIQTQTTQIEPAQVFQQAQQLASELDSARLEGLTDERLEAINRGAKGLHRLIQQV